MVERRLAFLSDGKQRNFRDHEPRRINVTRLRLQELAQPAKRLPTVGYLATLARPLGLPVGGENASAGDSLATAQTIVQRVRGWGLVGLMWLGEPGLLDVVGYAARVLQQVPDGHVRGQPRVGDVRPRRGVEAYLPLVGELEVEVRVHILIRMDFLDVR